MHYRNLMASLTIGGVPVGTATAPKAAVAKASGTYASSGNDGKDSVFAKFDFDGGTGTVLRYLGHESNVYIPETIWNTTVRHIGPEAFKDCNVETVILPETLETIGESAFENNPIKEIFIPDSVYRIGKDAFRSCNPWDWQCRIKGLKGIKHLEDGTFAEVYRLRLDAPALEEINAKAFLPQYYDGKYEPDYAVLFSKGNEKIESIEGICIVDPASYEIRFIDSENGKELMTTKEVTGYGYLTGYPKHKKLSDFLPVGHKLKITEETKLQGYFSRLYGKESVLEKAGKNTLEVHAKEFEIHVPEKIERNSSTYSGKTLPLSEVKLTVKERDESDLFGWGYLTRDYLEKADHNGNFTITGIDLIEAERVSIEAVKKDGKGSCKTESIELDIVKSDSGR